MEYKLGVKDRLMLLGVLPAEGALATIRIVNELRLALAMNEAEYADLQVIEGDGQLNWNQAAEAAAGPRAIEIGAKGQEIIRKALGKLDKDEKLAADHISICDIFEYTGD